jgi:hypothetical protein
MTNWHNRQFLIGLFQILAVVCILLLSVISSPLALIAAIGFALPILGASEIAAVLVVMFFVITLLH